MTGFYFIDLCIFIRISCVSLIILFTSFVSSSEHQLCDKNITVLIDFPKYFLKISYQVIIFIKNLQLLFNESIKLLISLILFNFSLFLFQFVLQKILFNWKNESKVCIICTYAKIRSFILFLWNNSNINSGFQRKKSFLQKGVVDM